MKPKDLVTLERGHLSLFRYPTQGNGTYLGRGAKILISVSTINILPLLNMFQTQELTFLGPSLCPRFPSPFL